MNFSTLTMLLIAALLHALWNLLSKKANGGAIFIWLMYLASTLIYFPALVYIVLQEGGTVFSQPLLWLSLSSAILHIGYFLILQKGYRESDLSVVYPLARGTGPLFSCIAAILFLNEPLKLNASIGLALILSGVFVITGIRLRGDNNTKIKMGVFFGILTGLFIAFYTFNDAVAVKTYRISPLLLTFVSNIFCTALLLPFVISRTGEIKETFIQHKWIILSIGLLSPAAYILVLEALKHAPLTLVAPLRETSILIGVFLGAKVLSEKDGKRRLIASGLILGGIIVLSI